MTINSTTFVLLTSIAIVATAVPVCNASELNSSQPHLEAVTLRLPLSISGDTELQSQFGLSASIPTTVESVNNTDWRKTALLIKQQKYQQAVTLLLPLAKSGDTESQTQLGSLYENGLGVPRNLDTARRWYESAAEQNYPRAQVNLGVLFQSGTGVSKDLTTAIYWFKKAVALNDPRAQAKLAYIYLAEPGYKQFENEAVELLKSSAEAGYQEAQFNFAMLLLEGERGITKDKTRATNLLKQSADQNNPAAMNVLAILYLRDSKTSGNIALAYELLQHSVDLGFEPARSNLAKLCRESPEVCQIKK